MLSYPWNRMRSKYRRIVADRLARRPFELKSPAPYISFTFDDFPRSAYLLGGNLLRKYGARGTYYVSMSLLGENTEVGSLASTDDILALLDDGHELGCHTYNHLDGWKASTDSFEQSIVENGRAFQDIHPDGRLAVFAYPLDGPCPSTKRAVGKHFVCCRGGGQDFNSGTIDLNLLKACFLDWRNHNNLSSVTALIERSVAEGGWLIFATHDVAVRPSRYGCTPGFFEEVVRQASLSGARILPVLRTCGELDLSSNQDEGFQQSPTGTQNGGGSSRSSN